jgi:hypothetical protein
VLNLNICISDSLAELLRHLAAAGHQKRVAQALSLQLTVRLFVLVRVCLFLFWLFDHFRLGLDEWRQVVPSFGGDSRAVEWLACLELQA